MKYKTVSSLHYFGIFARIKKDTPLSTVFLITTGEGFFDHELTLSELKGLAAKELGYLLLDTMSVEDLTRVWTLLSKSLNAPYVSDEERQSVEKFYELIHALRENRII